jgi:hypothetical protein
MNSALVEGNVGMLSSKSISIMTALVALCMAGLYAPPSRAAESVPGDQSLVEGQDAAAEAPAESHHAPLKLNTIDYQDVGDSGKLTLAGIALPGKELYLFLDDEPLAKAVPGDDGKWNLEKDLKLDDKKHTLRADQYDDTTGMLAARAMVSIERAKPGGDAEGQAAPSGTPPKETTP